jgi:hypothetical protein
MRTYRSLARLYMPRVYLLTHVTREYVWYTVCNVVLLMYVRVSTGVTSKHSVPFWVLFCVKVIFTLCPGKVYLHILKTYTPAQRNPAWPVVGLLLVVYILSIYLGKGNYGLTYTRPCGKRTSGQVLQQAYVNNTYVVYSAYIYPCS